MPLLYVAYSLALNEQAFHYVPPGGVKPVEERFVFKIGYTKDLAQRLTSFRDGWTYEGGQTLPLANFTDWVIDAGLDLGAKSEREAKVIEKDVLKWTQARFGKPSIASHLLAEVDRLSSHIPPLEWHRRYNGATELRLVTPAILDMNTAAIAATLNDPLSRRLVRMVADAVLVKMQNEFGGRRVSLEPASLAA